MSLSKRIFAFLLAMVIFISSGGVVLAVHYCSKKSNKEISLFSNNSCCSKKSSHCDKKNSTSSLKKKCCDLKVSYHKVDISSTISDSYHFDLHELVIENFRTELRFFLSSLPTGEISNKAPPFFRGGISFLHISNALLI